MLRGEAGLLPEALPRPALTLLPANERRRAPDTVAISLEVAWRACQDAGVDPAHLPTVFTSTHGDLAITDYMCATLADSPDALSPTKFHNSVHNAAAGYWSIATGCMAPYTAVTAWQNSFGAGLLEALVQVHSEQRSVMLVAYDIEGKGPLASQSPSEHLLAGAWVFAPARTPRTHAAIDWEVARRDGQEETGVHSAAALALRGNAMHQCLPLLETLARREAGPVIYPLGVGQVLSISNTSFYREWIA